MSVLRKRVYVLLSLAILSLVVIVFILIQNAFVYKPNTRLFLLSVLIFTVFLATFLFWKYKRLKTALLIVENQILHICPAMIEEDSRHNKASLSSRKVIEVFVSCFGILIGCRMIEFNQSGISLKAIEIGRDYILFTYGTYNKTQKIRLLHAVFDDQELKGIIDKFQYETGVIPTIIE